MSLIVFTSNLLRLLILPKLFARLNNLALQNYQCDFSTGNEVFIELLENANSNRKFQVPFALSKLLNENRFAKSLGEGLSKIKKWIVINGL